MLLCLLLAIAPAVLSCSDSEQSEVADGDDDSVESDLENEEEKGGDDPKLSTILMKGTSNEGGNARDVFLTFAPYFSSTRINWNRIDFTFSSVMLPEASDCKVEDALELEHEAGVFTLSLFSTPSVRLNLQVPEERDFCTMDFIMPSTVIPYSLAKITHKAASAATSSFYAEGYTADGLRIVISTDQFEMLSFLPVVEYFRWGAEPEYKWVAALDLGVILPEELMDNLEAGEDSILRIDAENNEKYLAQTILRIINGFAIYKDLNDNGVAEVGERGEDNTVAYGSRNDTSIDGDADDETDIDGDIVIVRDRDRDGRPDDEDNCPDKENPNQEDRDSDNVGDVCDNCPDISNFSQLNSDQDDPGDACDNCPFTENPDQDDDDLDKSGNLCDNCPIEANERQEDFDEDGIGDVCDPTPQSGDFCIMVQCVDLIDYCSVFDLECISDGFPGLGLCSKICTETADCPAPYACIDQQCACAEGSELLGCPLMECRDSSDCSGSGATCKSPESYCTVPCTDNTYCKSEFGDNWICLDDESGSGKRCICMPEI